MPPLVREYNILKSAGLSDEFIVAHYSLVETISYKAHMLFFFIVWSSGMCSIFPIAHALITLNLLELFPGIILAAFYSYVIVHINLYQLSVALKYTEPHLVRNHYETTSN